MTDVRTLSLTYQQDDWRQEHIPKLSARWLVSRPYPEPISKKIDFTTYLSARRHTAFVFPVLICWSYDHDEWIIFCLNQDRLHNHIPVSKKTDFTTLSLTYQQENWRQIFTRPRQPHAELYGNGSQITHWTSEVNLRLGIDYHWSNTPEQQKRLICSIQSPQQSCHCFNISDPPEWTNKQTKAVGGWGL